jgi:hypothetical protein
MSDTVVAIVSAFFVIGIVVGFIVVVAMSVLRADRRGGHGASADPLDFRSGGRGERIPQSRWDDSDPDDQPRWPGDDDNDFIGR